MWSLSSRMQAAYPIVVVAHNHYLAPGSRRGLFPAANDNASILQMLLLPEGTWCRSLEGRRRQQDVGSKQQASARRTPSQPKRKGSIAHGHKSKNRTAISASPPERSSTR